MQPITETKRNSQRASLSILSCGHSRYIITAINEVITTFRAAGVSIDHMGISPDKWYNPLSMKSSAAYRYFNYQHLLLPRVSNRTTDYWSTPRIDLELKQALPSIVAFMEDLLADFKPDVFLIADDWGLIEVFILEYLNWKKIPVVFMEHGPAVFNAAFSGDNLTLERFPQDWENRKYHLPGLKPSGLNADYLICSYSLPTKLMMVKLGVDPAKIRDTGFPYLDTLYREKHKYSPPRNADPKRILIVSNGMGTFGGYFSENSASRSRIFIQLIEVLQAEGYHVALRLKPGEEIEALLDPGLLQRLRETRVTYDDNTVDSFIAIQNYDLVIGELSTVLLESLILGIPVVMMTPAYGALERTQAHKRHFLQKVIGVLTLSGATEFSPVIKQAFSESYLKQCRAKLQQHQDYYYKIDGRTGERVASAIIEAVVTNLTAQQQLDEVEGFRAFWKNKTAGSAILKEAAPDLKPNAEQVGPGKQGRGILVSVIIPTRDHADALQAAIASVVVQNLGQLDFEILAVDNGSTDHTKATVERAQTAYPHRRIKYIFEPVPGLLAGRHCGARKARGDILVFIDDDIEAAPGWLSAIVEAFDDPSVHLVGGPSLPLYEVPPPDWMEKFIQRRQDTMICGSLSLLDLGREKIKIDPTYVWGLNFSIRKQTLFNLGGFHPDGVPGHMLQFRGDGETGLGLKMRKHGLSAVYVPAAKVYHCIPKARLTVNYMAKRNFAQGISDSYTQIRNNRGVAAVNPPVYSANNGNSNDARGASYSPDREKVYHRINDAYIEGFHFHYNAVKQNEHLLNWVLQETYFDYRPPDTEVAGKQASLPVRPPDEPEPGPPPSAMLSAPDLAVAAQQTLPPNILQQLESYKASPLEERQDHMERTQKPHANLAYYAGLKDRLSAQGVCVREVKIDSGEFDAWRQSFPEIESFYESAGDVRIEKCLEHFLVHKYLDLKPQQTYIDVAASGSPWASVLKKNQIQAYRLDRAYREGVHGMNIGADAARTGLSANSCNGLSLQCAFECFMGDADVRFIKEASRILAPGGKYAITPLYLESDYFIMTSPLADQAQVIIDPGAKRVWRTDAYVEPFSRKYSPEGFAERIYRHIPTGTRAEVLYFSNLGDLMKNYQGQRIYSLFMLLGQKAH